MTIIFRENVVQQESFGPRKKYDLAFVELNKSDTSRTSAATLHRQIEMYQIPFNKSSSKCALEGTAYCATSFMALQTEEPLFSIDRSKLFKYRRAYKIYEKSVGFVVQSSTH